MSKTLKRITIITVILVIIAAVVWQFTRPKPIAVTAHTVERGDVEASVANTRAGTIKACRRAGLSPAMGGQIARLPVKKGDQVKAGELLLALWNDDLQAQVALAEQQVRAARAQSEAACIQADIAQREAQRLIKLNPSGAVTAQLLDQAQGKASAAKAECGAAQANTQVARASMGVAGANLARTLLIAPFDGVVAEINSELNEYVTPSPPGILTLPAIDLIDNHCFYIAAPIDEVDASAIKQGMPARITLDAFKQQHFAGRVRRIADYVLDREKQARTVDIEVEFVELPKGLLAGYSADAEIILESRPQVLRIPTVAVMEGPAVLLYDRGSVVKREIKTGIKNWDYTEVLSGLAEGDQVITSLDRAGVVEGATVTLDSTPQ
ncbi:MAG: efflux RND transporter periplasmic adaptor subunit [Pseudomonadota bacterium]|nr:efflux RND transporter periplasmic adaptor subunit [Pseudomonadota bacterium]